jgi:hypothetical protein
MNSLKSVCSFTKSTPVPLDQLQQHLEPVFRRKFSIELIVGLIRIFETTEHLNNAVHGSTLACAHSGIRRTASIEKSRSSSATGILNALLIRSTIVRLGTFVPRSKSLV